MDSPASESIPTTEQKPESTPPERAKRFRFKMKRDRSASPRSDERRHHRHHSTRHSRRKRSRDSTRPTHGGDDASHWDESVSSLPPDVAFRESLFDALGDDEGAAFWQSVYGQPIHTYPNSYENQETGELERMTEDEYASYVRRKMWEKSWEGIEAAREEQRRAREQEKRREQEGKRSRHSSGTNRPPDSLVFDLEIEQSLKRGERRKEKRKWQARWETYQKQWDQLHSLYEQRRASQVTSAAISLRDRIAWPAESGKRSDVTTEAVEHFFRSCAESANEKDDLPAYAAILRAERVRFHPDKIQQRYGFMEIDESTKQGVTAVFQILDDLWNQYRIQQEKQV